MPRDHLMMVMMVFTFASGNSVLLYSSSFLLFMLYRKKISKDIKLNKSPSARNETWTRKPGVERLQTSEDSTHNYQGWWKPGVVLRGLQ